MATRSPVQGSQGKLFILAATLIVTMGLSLALAPWLGDTPPILLAAPAVGVISVVCGVGWALGLAALVLLWITVPWLPPNWPDDALAYRAISVMTLGAAAMTGMLAPIARLPSRETRTLSDAQRWLRRAMAIAVALPLALLAILAWTSQEAAVARARAEAESAVHLAAEHVGRIIQANAIISRQIQVRLREESPAPFDKSDSLHRYLVGLAEGLPQLNSIWIVGADGFPVASSLFARPPRISYADREYFKFHSAQRDQVFVSRLLRTRSTQELFFDVSGRWEDSEGEFRGVINTTLKPEYFVEFYRRIVRTTPALSIVLFRDDGYLLARWPDPVDVDDRLKPDSAVLTAARAGAQGWVNSGRDTGGAADDSAVLRKLDPFPLHVAVTLDRPTVMQAWAREVALLGALLLAASLALLGALWVALGRTQRELVALDRLSAETEQRRRAEEALRQAQKLEALGQLTGGVAHDFNNLLAVVQNNLYVLARKHPELSQSTMLASMQRAVRSGEQLARKLLAFSRRQALRPEVIDLAQALPQVAEMMRLTVGRTVQIEISVAPNTPPIDIDRSEFELALLNLAMNARAAMPGTGRIGLHARSALVTERPEQASPNAAFVTIEVSDDGAGMSAEVRDRAFEPFFTTKPEGQGTGLGLSQVYGLCAQSGGIARISSDRGGGTTVSLVLPASTRPISGASSVVAASARRLSANVLVVDDNAELAGATAAVLETLGVRAHCVHDTEAAERLLADDRDNIDLVLSDIVMPGAKNGLALARTLRARYPDLPILLTTGHATEVGGASASGFVVLQKPVSPATLEQALREALGADQPVARRG